MFAHAQATPPGDWSTAEKLLDVCYADPMLDLLYFESLSAQTVLTSAGEALDVTPHGPYQLAEEHGDQTLGRSVREQDAPEEWRVVGDAEESPG